MAEAGGRVHDDEDVDHHHVGQGQGSVGQHPHEGGSNDEKSTEYVRAKGLAFPLGQ